MILKCAGCGNSIDVILSKGVEVDIGIPGEWRASMILIYRGEACECAMTIRNPEMADEVKKWTEKNPQTYKETMDQLRSKSKRHRNV